MHNVHIEYMFILQTVKSLKERFKILTVIGRSTDNTIAKRKGEEVQTIQWPNEKGNKYRQYNDQTKRGTSTDNTMAKRKGEQVQTIQWPNEEGNKYRQYNGQTKRGTSTDNAMDKRKGEEVQTIQ